MRYLFFMGSLKAGGAERTLSRLSSYLCEQGDEVHIVLRKNVIQFTLHEKVKVHLVGELRHRTPFGKILSLRGKVARVIRQVEPDAVCALNGLSGVILADTFTKNTTVRFSTYPRNLRKWKQSLFYTHFRMGHVKNIICLTENMRKDMVRVLPRHKLEVIHNAAIHPPAQAFADVEATEGRPHRRYIVSLGRLSVAKAYDVALRAFAAAKAYETHDYVLIGGGVAEASLRELATQLGIEQYVHFVGYRSNPYPLLAGADIFLHTSVREGFPNVLLEALSLGVPVIATDCKTGPAAIIEFGVNGFLAEVNSVHSVAERLRFLLDNEDVRQQIAHNAPATLEKFDERKIFAQWRRILSAAVN